MNYYRAVIHVYFTGVAGLLALTDSVPVVSRRAGMPTCAVAWGYGEPEELARWEPDFWIDAPHQLLPDY